MQKLGLGLSLAAMTILSACDGDSDPNRPNNNRPGNKDATVTSTTGGMDAGIVDTGPTGPCNPVDGSGCTMGQLCAFVINLPEGLCQDPAAAPKQINAQCDINLRDCAAGLVCLQLTGDPMPTCRKVCNNGADSDCAGLAPTMGGGQFNCAGLQNPATMMTAAYSYCRESTSCEPWNDMCPMGQKCQQVAADAVGCGMEGMATAGMACQGPGGCVKGAICVNLGGGGQCYEACNATGGTCSDMNQRCGGLMNGMGQPLPYGICQDRPMSCNPADDMCPMGQSCALTSQTEVGCLTEGTNGTGQPCGGAMGGCMRGHICVDTGGGATCQVACDMANPCAMGAMCNMGLGSFPFGICP